MAKREVMARPGGEAGGLGTGQKGDLGGQERGVTLDVLSLKCLRDVQVEMLVDS